MVIGAGVGRAAGQLSPNRTLNSRTTARRKEDGRGKRCRKTEGHSLTSQGGTETASRYGSGSARKGLCRDG